MPTATGKDASAKPGPRSGFRFRWVAAVAALVALTVAVLASTDPGHIAGPGESKPAPVIKTLARIETVRVTPTDLSESLSLSGEVTAAVRTTVSAEVAGLVGQVTHLPGEPVTTGEVLATIAPEDYHLALEAREAELAGLSARLRLAKSALDRTSRLAARGASSIASLEDAQRAVDELLASVAAVDAAVRLAEVNLERATVRASITGIIASRLVEPGQLVQAGTALFEIIDLTTVTVEAMVPLTRAHRLREGQAAQFWSPEEPARRIEARVSRIGPRAETGTRSAKVYLEIDNAAHGLRAGTFLTGRVEIRRAEGRLALPPGAIRNQGRDTDVLAIRDGRAVLLPVALGAKWDTDGLVEITAGLQPGDLVVALPLAGLEPGDRVAMAGD